MAEKLAREISRVTVVKCHLEETKRLSGNRVNIDYLLSGINTVLEGAFAASGSGDAISVLRICAALEEIHE